MNSNVYKTAFSFFTFIFLNFLVLKILVSKIKLGLFEWMDGVSTNRRELNESRHAHSCCSWKWRRRAFVVLPASLRFLVFSILLGKRGTMTDDKNDDLSRFEFKLNKLKEEEEGMVWWAYCGCSVTRPALNWLSHVLLYLPACRLACSLPSRSTQTHTRTQTRWGRCAVGCWQFTDRHDSNAQRRVQCHCWLAAEYSRRSVISHSILIRRRAIQHQAAAANLPPFLSLSISNTDTQRHKKEMKEERTHKNHHFWLDCSLAASHL